MLASLADFLNDPQVSLQLEWAVATVGCSLCSIAALQTLIDWWRG